MGKTLKAITISIILLIVIASIFLSIFFISIYWETEASAYTQEQHIERIAKLIEKKYVDRRNYNKEFEIYPVYNEKDDMEYCIVELQPAAFLYVKINDTGPAMPLFFGNNMYSKYEVQKWRRYRIIQEGEDPIQYPNSNWKIDNNYNKLTNSYYGSLCEVNNEGDFIEYRQSYYKVAGVENERRYLLKDKEENYVPAIKKDGKYINLLSMEEMDLPVDILKHATESITFYKDPNSVL